MYHEAELSMNFVLLESIGMYAVLIFRSITERASDGDAPRWALRSDCRNVGLIAPGQEFIDQACHKSSFGVGNDRNGGKIQVSMQYSTPNLILLCPRIRHKQVVATSPTTPRGSQHSV